MYRLFGCRSNQFGVLNKAIGGGGSKPQKTGVAANTLSVTQTALAGWKPAQPSVITNPIAGNPNGIIPKIHVRDSTNGYDLYTLNNNDVYNFPASCTKFMTLLLIWEMKQSVIASETVTVTTADVTQPYAGVVLSFAGLQNNDILTWQDLMYCMVLPSGGDACACAARILGDALYVAAGSTGTQGMARFVERMNARAAELGMTNTVYFDPYGGSKQGATIRNTISAKDLNTVSTLTMAPAAMRVIMSATTRNCTITGVNARTLTVSNGIPFFNGPTNNAAGVKDTTILAAKGGAWILDSDSVFNMSFIWHTPAGFEVVVTLLGSETLFSNMLDLRGLMYQALHDFPYLRASAGTDASFSSVKLLVGADSGITDESGVGRTITNDLPSGTTTAIIDAGASINLNSDSANIYVVDALDLAITTGDFTNECWYAGPGTPPGGGVEYIFGSKVGVGAADLEYAVNWFNGSFSIFASSNSTNWNNTVAYTMNTVEQNVFFNGAPRHIAYVKSGSAWHMYINGERLPPTISIDPPHGAGKLYIAHSGAVARGKMDEFRITMGVARYTLAMHSILPLKFPRS